MWYQVLLSRGVEKDGGGDALRRNGVERVGLRYFQASGVIIKSSVGGSLRNFSRYLLNDSSILYQSKMIKTLIFNLLGG